MARRVKNQPHLAAGAVAGTQPEHEGVLPALQARSQDKRDRLLTAGLSVFGELGYEAARVADIAAAAGLSVGVFYQRFRDKQAFFFALQSEFVKRATHYMAAMLAQSPSHLQGADMLERLFANRLRMIQQNVGFFRGLVALSHVEPKLRPPALALDSASSALLFAHLQAREMLPPGIDSARVHFGVAAVTRVMVFTALVTDHATNLAETPLPRQLAEMLAGYIGLQDAAPASAPPATRRARTRKV